MVDKENSKMKTQSLHEKLLIRKAEREKIKSISVEKAQERLNSPKWIEFLASEKYNIIQNLRKKFGNNIYETKCKLFDPDNRIYLKCEHNQFSGCYNVRGALAVLQNVPAEMVKTENNITLVTKGDEASAFCYATEKLNIPTHMLLLEPMPVWRETMCEEYKYSSVSMQLLEKSFLETEKDLFTKAYNLMHHKKCHNTMIDAYGTIGLEIVEQVPDVDVVILPNNDNALIKGISWVIKHYDPSIQIVVVDIDNNINNSSDLDDIIITSLKLEYDNMVDNMIKVKESWVYDTMCFIYSQNIIVDRASASTISACMKNHSSMFENKTIVLLMTSGNIDISLIPTMLQQERILRGWLMAFTIKIPNQLRKEILELCEFMHNIMEVHIRDISHEEIADNIFIKAICEMVDNKQYEELICLLESKYQKENVKILYHIPVISKDATPEFLSPVISEDATPECLSPVISKDLKHKATSPFIFEDSKSEATSIVTSEEPKSKTTNEDSKPEATSEDPKPEAISEEPKPEAISEDPKPEATSEDPKPEAISEEPKPEAISENPKPEATSEDPKPETTSEDPKPKATSKDPKPRATSKDPKPRATSEDPKPKATSEDPKPKATSEDPKSEPTSEDPKPEPTSEDPKSEPTSEDPKPEPTSEDPKPEPTSEDPKLETIIED